MTKIVTKGQSLCHIYKNGCAVGAPIHQISFSPPDPEGRVVRARKAPGAAGRLLKMSSACKEGHLMWPSSCIGLFEILSKRPAAPGAFRARESTRAPFSATR